MQSEITLTEHVEDLPLDVFEMADDGTMVESLSGIGSFRTGCCNQGNCSGTCYYVTCQCFC